MENPSELPVARPELSPGGHLASTVNRFVPGHQCAPRTPVGVYFCGPKRPPEVVMRWIGFSGAGQWAAIGCLVVGCSTAGEVDPGSRYQPPAQPDYGPSEPGAVAPGETLGDAPEPFELTGTAGMAAPEPLGQGAEDTEDGAPDDRPPCIDDPQQAAIIGDSYINWVSHSLPADLTARIGHAFPMHAIGGASMASGGVAGFIPDQYDNAKAQQPDLRFVIMTGGGNDLLVPDGNMTGASECKNSLDSPSMPICQQVIDLALDEARTLLMRAAQDGVRDVVYFFYPRIPEGTIVGGTHPNTILDHALPQARAFCDNAVNDTHGALRCHFVDMTPVFGGDTSLFAPTDIHPNLAGSAKMADAIWDTMTEACIGQPSSSGCCAP